MKRILSVLFVVLQLNVWAQVNDESRWVGYFSYNHVDDFALSANAIHAIAGVASFSFDKNTNEATTYTTIDGLTGDAATSLCYSETFEKKILGYENGLLQIIDSNSNVYNIYDIVYSELVTNKRINSIYEYDGNVYLGMPFGIIVYSLDREEFVDTYFIGLNSSEVLVNEIVVLNGYIYAAATDGIYIADFNSNLNDSDNWNLVFTGNFGHIKTFDGQVVVAKDKTVSAIVNNTSLQEKLSMSNTIIDMSSNDSYLNVASTRQGFVYDDMFSLITSTSSSDHTVTSVNSDLASIYLGTKEKGVLRSAMEFPDEFTELYPDGPLSNEAFSISVKQGHMWCVYGGYDEYYTPKNKQLGISHFQADDWTHIPYNELNAKDLNHVTFDQSNINKVYISSWGQGSGPVDTTTNGGVLIVENNVATGFWNRANSGMSGYPENVTSGYSTTRVAGSAYDSEGNLWFGNSILTDGSGFLKKYGPDGTWSGHNLTDESIKLAINNIEIDAFDNVLVGSRGKGLYLYAEEGNKSAVISKLNSGNALPHDNVRTVAADANNRIWIGTFEGLVVLDDVENVYTGNYEKPAPVIIVVDGVASELLGKTTINDIYVDGANNKWFATNLGGVTQTNASGQKILATFTKENSPLPSNDVLNIEMDEATGVVYFLTTRGIVAYNTGIASYGDQLNEVYGYPNPSLKQHNTVSLVGKDGANLPEGTNVKILDVAGNLVFESNTIESQSSFGGKIVWDKRNLAGQKVASGVYIVLMYNEDGEQTASTKIAIIN